VRSAKPKMATRCSEVLDLPSIGPVVNCLQIDLAESRDLRRREQILWFAGSGHHPSWVTVQLTHTQGITGKNWKNCTLANRRGRISPGAAVEDHSRCAWKHRVALGMLRVTGQGEEPTRSTGDDARPNQGRLP